MKARTFLAAAGAASGLLSAAPAHAAPITLTPVGTPFNRVVGIDYHEPTNKVLTTVNYPSGEPYNFELVAQDGTGARYGTTHGLTDELKVATVRSGPCRGGFAVGDTFSGTGRPGEILRISPDGATVQQPWVNLPGETGLLRGGLFQDRYCVVGGDLVVVTTSGGVWRITSAGVATRLARTGTHLEGVTTLPDDPARYGPWAGKIVAGAEQQSRFYEIDPGTGAFAGRAVAGIQPEDLDVIPANENLFAVHFGTSRLLAATADQFTSMVGDLLVTQEYSSLHRLRWNGADFEAERIAEQPGGNFEHVTFAPSGIVNIPPVNRPPDADAGPDRAVAQESPAGAQVTLDGIGSSDPDGDALTYEWSDGSTGARPTVTAPVGTTTYTLTVTDEHGLQDTDTVDVTVAPDTNGPLVVASRTPDANAFGWNNEPVTVHYECSDPQSGIVFCNPDQLFDTDGLYIALGIAVNGAGLKDDSAPGLHVNIDRTAPGIAFGGNRGTYGVDDRVTITCSASDALSGIRTRTCESVDAPAHTLGGGTHTLTGTAVDYADNETTGTATFTIAITADDLCALVQDFVDQRGVENSLCVKLRNGALGAFRNEVRAQTGKHGLTAGEAERLIALSRELQV